MEEKDIKERKNKYEKLLIDCFYQTNGIKSIFYMGDSQSEKTMTILEIFGTEQEQWDFLELSLEKNNKIINDEYLSLILKTGFLKPLKPDFLGKEDYNRSIEKFKILLLDTFLNDKIFITDRKNFILFLKRLSYLINISFYDLEWLPEENFIPYIKKELEEWKNKKSYTLIDTVKIKIDKGIALINKLESVYLENISQQNTKK